MILKIGNLLQKLKPVMDNIKSEKQRVPKYDEKLQECEVSGRLNSIQTQPDNRLQLVAMDKPGGKRHLVMKIKAQTMILDKAMKEDTLKTIWLKKFIELTFRRNTQHY